MLFELLNHPCGQSSIGKFSRRTFIQYRFVTSYMPSMVHSSASFYEGMHYIVVISYHKFNKYWQVLQMVQSKGLKTYNIYRL